MMNSLAIMIVTTGGENFLVDFVLLNKKTTKQEN